MTTARIPYPSHPYQSSASLAAMLIQNGLSGISQHDLAQKIDLAGYYRLKGYWYPFLTKDQTNIGKRKLPFQPGTAWNTIEERYTFDQELRNIVFDGIVTIEVFLKSNISSELAKANGPLGYIQATDLPNLSLKEYQKALNCFLRDFERSSLPHLEHFKRTYSDALPPVWMLVDSMTYGEFKISLYKGADSSIKEHLAAKLGIVTGKVSHGNERLLGDWMETLRVARNMAAHHERLWNSKSKKLQPAIPRSNPNNPVWWGNDWDPFRTTKGPAAFLTMEYYLLKQLGVAQWRTNFVNLMNRYPNIPLNQMGFPANWQSLPIWQ
ncbi:Abi family protein [Bifidobacterium xylocopae]|uniref:CAAX protease n=1 Tax=Bifidobacterium xylocopae TaxID=2493119 RepID=A0A366KBC5_9BIFI|nr:Abi family protein [Bifidobacterium xylocopae]RBP98899.1 hypothetical protein CRD59_06590 [Bifidobacterium xylocopae]